ncbi:hypothetical protein AHAS_Ahas16G0154800 [Arachis hypogaea]
MLRVGLISIWWGLLVTTRGSIIAIGLIFIRSGIIPIRDRRRLLPRRLNILLRLLPPLIVPFLMYILIVISISYNIVVTTLIAKRMRIHNSKSK